LICKCELSTHKIAHPYCIRKAELAVEREYKKITDTEEMLQKQKIECEIAFKDLYRMEVDNQ
jgi:hypothetical protein